MNHCELCRNSNIGLWKKHVLLRPECLNKDCVCHLSPAKDQTESVFGEEDKWIYEIDGESQWEEDYRVLWFSGKHGGRKYTDIRDLVRTIAQKEYERGREEGTSKEYQDGYDEGYAAAEKKWRSY